MANLYTQLLDLLPGSPLEVGEVISSADGMTRVELPGGGQVVVRGTATAGTQVFIKDGAIQGAAPALAVVLFEV